MHLIYGHNEALLQYRDKMCILLKELDQFNKYILMPLNSALKKFPTQFPRLFVSK